ncbi:MAG: hypothetical protein QMC89_03175 [Candidatus Hodarchaeaceae archaeon]|nr:hypothetical protein [Candidatus Hodarchaeaceae archaeon]
MSLTQILKTLVVCILAIILLLVTVSAYRQHRDISALAALSDATSAIAARLTAEELAYVDNISGKRCYILDPNGLENLTFVREIGKSKFEFQATLHYKRGGEEGTFGPYGPMPPSDEASCSLMIACSLWMNNRVLPAKLGVIAWYA